MNVQFESLRPSAVTALFEYALQFYAVALDVPDNITLEVVTLDDHFLDEQSGMPAKEGEAIMGAVYFPDEQYDTDHMNTFRFGFWYGCTPGQLFQVMAHEMVHIRQYATRQLRTIRTENGLTNFWDALPVTSAELDYFDLPWEIEAYALQDGLLESLVEDAGFLSLVNEMAQNQAA